MSDGGPAGKPVPGVAPVRSKAELAAEVRRQLVGYERRAGTPLKRSALAKKAGVSTSSLYAYLNGTTLPPTVTFDRILDALGLPAAVRQRLATARDDLEVQEKVPPTAATPAPPRELPPDVSGFTGRADQLAALDRLLARADGPAAVVISAVSGTAGVGKTALAVRWAHRVHERFPDGSLYVDLRGYGPEQPMQPAEALEGFLRSLGVTGADMPTTLAQRAARYRSLLADRETLILLDNARTAEQVRDLLPGTPTCAVLVTSRDSLAGLVARNGAGRIDLDLLTPGEAVTLLRALVGARVDAEPDVATALADRCARLPLALRIAAELAASRPHVPLADLVAEFDRHRLDLLTAGDDQQTAVRAVFSWSYRHLPDGAARAFRLLGLQPGRETDRYALAALLGGAPDDAQQHLDTLARAHLVRAIRPGRYGMHDLLRAYAVELGERTEPAAARDAALTRLLAGYLDTAGRAADHLDPGRRHIPDAEPGHQTPGPQTPALETPGPQTPGRETSAAQTSGRDTSGLESSGSESAGPRSAGPAIGDRDEALAWLDTELPNLLAVIDHAAARGPGRYAWQLAHTLWRYLDGRGELAAWVASHRRALTVIDADHDPWAYAETLHNLASAYWRSGRLADARGHYEQALPLRRRLGDRLGEANTLNNLALIAHDSGHYQPAIDHLGAALALYRGLGHEWGEANSLNVVGNCLRGLGRYRESLDYHGPAAALYRKVGHQRGEAGAVGNLGRACYGLGQYEDAIGHYQQSLALFEQVGDPDGEAGCMINLGSTYRVLGDHERAESHLQRALAVAGRLGALPLRSEALNALGAVHTATGRYDEAVSSHLDALAVATQVGHRYQQAVAHRGTADALHHLGRPEPAGRHIRQALDIFDALGSPEADQIRAAGT